MIEGHPTVFDTLEAARIHAVSLELGADLIGFVQPDPTHFLDQLTTLRRQIAHELGMVLPPLRVAQGSSGLRPREYMVLIQGARAGGGEVHTDRLLTFDPPAEIAGEAVLDPIYGVPAMWVRKADENRLQQPAYDASSVIIMHLNEVVRRHAAELLTRQDVRHMLDFCRKWDAEAVEALLDDIPLATVRKVFQNLLAEGVSLRPLSVIVEALADASASSRDASTLTEVVRAGLARLISDRAMDAQGVVSCLVLSPDVERLCAAGVERLARGEAPMEPATGARLVAGINLAMREVGRPLPLVVQPSLRLLVRRVTEAMMPALRVLSYSELMPLRPPRPTIRAIQAVALAPEGPPPAQ
ncbi:MAG: FHIPEP family type III secretion protein [Candidatus Xenobia bacterium]